MRARTLLTTTASVVTLGLLASGCTLLAADDDPGEVTDAQRGDGTGRVVLVTHDSYALPKRLVADFEAESGIDLVQRASGDAGSLTNRLVLTQDDPIGDVAFGVDNTFASRALEEDVFAPYDAELPPGADEFVLPDGADRLAPVDEGNVCVNVDEQWFAERDQEPPASLDDLTDPAYRDLLVVPGAPTSSPGLAFLLATVDEYGDDWPTYWEDLVANGVEIVPGWSDAYQVDFTAGGGGGDRPIVVSYDSSPAFTLTEDGDATTTAALLDTCYQQVEYAGVLENAENPVGAERVVDWLLSSRVQAELPTSMYVFPVRDDVDLPRDWASYAERPDSPYALDPDAVAAERADLLAQWSDVTSR
ncbi:thiamine ABC transporter substrate-binding protein [uncultured Nocardioides sp.]|uniref:thiamine ABC transporter substrate-binding protein n=1 Tax=uncultured Nocardioides sp. TaxID=198441 RepID=UPI0026053B2A|nr:thiamine ABC transporter substrate-binding protein [uncultured Nocardioides sp.]